MSKRILQLDTITINKIAAGEVIENPKSIVKELIENSIDANADEIIIEIRKGGKELIRITDNGIGIEKNEVSIAFKRHTTSKINCAEDLNKVKTLGFRGEALASIAAVSKVEIITKTHNSTSGLRMIIEGGEIISKNDIGCPIGTTIIIKDLFYNVPARKKFLKSDSRESANINELVTNLSMSTTKVSFKLINNENIIIKTPKTSNFFNTIVSIYGKDLYNSLINVDYSNEDFRIYGYISNLNYYRGNRKNQIIFVNDRYIKNIRINYAIDDAYRTMLPINKYPVCFLKIYINSDAIDVNVHPAKTEIRFDDEQFVRKQIINALSTTLNKELIIKEVKSEKIVSNYSKIEEKQNKIESSNYNIFTEDFSDNNVVELNDIKADENYFGTFITKEDNLENNTEQEKFETISNNSVLNIPDLEIIGLLFNTYILCENREENEFCIIDQHAAHERINYEKLLEQINNKKIVSQELIVPEIIELSPQEYYTTISYKNYFKEIGLIIENFGINSIIVTSLPSVLSNVNVKDLFFTVLDSIKTNSNENLDLGKGKIIKAACSKSVKAGDKLHIIELKKLIKDLFTTNNPLTCPHGRPVLIKMKKYEIEKLFERIQN